NFRLLGTNAVMARREEDFGTLTQRDDWMRQEPGPAQEGWSDDYSGIAAALVRKLKEELRGRPDYALSSGRLNRGDAEASRRVPVSPDRGHCQVGRLNVTSKTIAVEQRPAQSVAREPVPNRLQKRPVGRQFQC